MKGFVKLGDEYFALAHITHIGASTYGSGSLIELGKDKFYNFEMPLDELIKEIEKAQETQEGKE